MGTRQQAQSGLTATSVGGRVRHVWTAGGLIGLLAWCTATPARAMSGSISSPVAGPISVDAGETLEIALNGSVTVGNAATAVTVKTGGTLKITGGSVSGGCGVE